MKVLFISSWYPTKNNPNFGIFIKEHAKAIQTSEIDIVVLAIITERSKSILNIIPREYIDESGIRTVEIILSSRFKDIIHHLIPFQNHIAYHYYQKQISPTFIPDIIHSNVVFPAGIIGNFISRKLHKPHIITEHWSKIAGILQKPFLSILVKKTYRNALKILPVSEFLKNNMVTMMPFLNTEKFSIIPNVINSETFTYKAKPTLSNELKFCAVATWATKKIPDKKPELFIEALSAVQLKTQYKIKLTMVGGGDRVEELKKLCEKQSYKTEFVNYQTKEQINVILQNSDYFIHASTIETFGVVAVEAFMTGTPVICSNIGALPEVVNETNGVLCNNTLESWIEGIERAINKQFNHEDIAKNISTVYNAKSIGKKIFAIYKKYL